MKKEKTEWTKKVAQAKAYILQYGDTQEARHEAAINSEQISSAQWKEAAKK